MKIVSGSIEVFELPYRKPLVGVAWTTNAIQIIAIEIRTDDGVTGTTYGWALSRVVAFLIAAAAKAATTIVIGADPRMTNAAWDKIRQHLSFTGSSGVSRMGLSLVDMALWDIRCRSLNLPLWRLIGGHKSHAPMYSSALIDVDIDGQSDIGAIKDASLRFASDGFRVLKMRFGLRPAIEDARRLREAMDAVPDIRGWAVDAGNRWDVAESVKACHLLRDTDLMWFEDPGLRDDYDALEKIASSTSVPICSGENIYVGTEAKSVIEAGCRYLSLDLQRCGGITGWIRLAALAEAAGISVTPHAYATVAVHLICSTANSPIGEYHPWFDDVVTEKIVPYEGMVAAFDTPGIGATPDRARLGAPIERLEIA
jgi:L-alanine-DL-glutamate epimerase-like enolase superfamily enzyme